jgi:hypothetical protein
MSNYLNDADEAADEWIDDLQDQIIEKLMEDGEASTDLNNDYSGADTYHHETHVDKDYDLQEAAELLNDLRDYEETDSGLWQGLEPQRAIAAQAAYTFGNAVYQMTVEKIEEINRRAEESFGDRIPYDEDAEKERFETDLGHVVKDEILNFDWNEAA